MKLNQNVAFSALLAMSTMLACSSDGTVDGDETGDVSTGGSGGAAGGSGNAAGGSGDAAGGSAFGTGGSGIAAGGSGIAAGGSGFGAGGLPMGSGGAAFGAGGGAAPSDGGTGSGGVDQGIGGSTGMQTDGEIYYEAICAECHGPTGDGLDGLGPDIKHPVEDYSEVIIRNGRVAHVLYEDDMDASSPEELPDDMLAEIFVFLAAQPQPTDGQGLYEDYCLACHGVDGRGGTTTRSLEMHLNDVAKLVRDGHVGAFEDRREYMPSWTTEQLTDAEVELISQYVKSLFGQ